MLPAFLDAKLDRLRRDRLAEPEAPIDHGHDRRVDESRDLLIRHDAAVELHLHVSGDPNDAMAVVTREIGGHQIFGDPAPLLGRAAGFGEDFGDEILERVRRHGDHRFRPVLR